jgi:aspartyl-tRNA synthetase
MTLSNSAVFTPRTQYCGEVTQDQIGKTLSINGWVSVNRDLGGLIFIEVRDRTGLVQIVADPQKNPDVHAIMSTLRSEDVVSVTGPVSQRPQDTINPNLATGQVEVYPTAVQVISRAKTPPFLPDNASEVDEALRMKYRYVDLRSERMQKNIRLRHEIAAAARNYLNSQRFLEIETPVLIKTTPEGARDYLVPSRVHAGKFFALPQSPQLFKQLLMVGGMDRYYQIARCFRDEDLRADRQPEFTQVDIEMSFAQQPQVMAMAEGVVQAMFEAAGVSVPLPLKQMPYSEAMGRYGSDKPDLRFGVELIDFTDIMAASEFKAFQSVATSGGTVKGICVPNTGHFSRKELDDTRLMAEKWGAKGLAYIVYSPEGLKSPITKFFKEPELEAITQRAGATEGCTLFFVADAPKVVDTLLGRLRQYFGESLNLIDTTKHELFWIVDFPLFEETDDGGISPNHHPFTSPHPDDIARLESDPKSVRAVAYDMVYNGNEIGGGSVRIHSRDLQQTIFKLLGFTDAEITEKFGFLTDAFEYGVPPHAGIAFGLDRVVALLCNEASIRDVIAFPKNNQAMCLMTNAPAEATTDQLDELHIRLKPQAQPQPAQ